MKRRMRIVTKIWLWSLLLPVTVAWGQADTLYTRDHVIPQKQPVTPLPSPKGALLRSAALPGWGQYYNGKRLKGSVFLLLQVGLLTGTLLQRSHTPSGGLTPLGNTLLFSLIGVRIYSMADAYVDAQLADFDDPQAHGRRPRVTVGLVLRW